MLNELYITDGSTSVDLLNGTDCFFLDKWTPLVASFKNGGVWRAPALTDGRKLQAYSFDNVIETFGLKVSAASPLELITSTQKLRRLLDQAVTYWTSSTAAAVYLKVKTEAEGSYRYALVYDGHAAQDGNPFAQPFNSNSVSEIADFPLFIERGHWQTEVPGTAVEIDLQTLHTARNIPSSTPSYNSMTLQYPNKLDYHKSTNRIFFGYFNLYYSDDYLVNETKVPNANYPPNGNTYGQTWITSLLVTKANTLLVLAISDSGSGGTSWLHRSTDNGVTFNQVYTATAYNATSDFIQLQSGKIWVGWSYAPIGIRESTDDGLTWHNFASWPYPSSAPYAFIQYADGSIVAACADKNYYKTTDEGAHWTYVGSTSSTWSGAYQMKQTPSGRTIVNCGNALYATDDQFATPPRLLFQSASLSMDVNFCITPDGIVWVTGYNAGLYKSLDDGNSFSLVSNLGAGYSYTGTFLYQKGIAFGGSPDSGATQRLYSLLYSVPYQEGAPMSAAADNQLVSNRFIDININHLLVYDASGPTYTEKVPITNFASPTLLSPGAIAAGDYLYLGADVPFYNLTMEQRAPDFTAWTTEIAYWNGAAWTPISHTVYGDRYKAGTLVFTWDFQTNWAKNAVNSITSYWIRFRLPDMGTLQVLTFQPYAPDTNFVELSSTALKGDIAALARFTALNVSDNINNTAPVANFKRCIVGKRAVSRGADFRSAFNLSTLQPDVRVTVTLGGSTAYISSDSASLTGQFARYSGAAGDTSFVDRVTVTLTSALARQYKGAFRAFLRGGTTTAAAGMSARLKVITGSGGVTQYSSSEGAFKGSSAGGSDKYYYELVDLGRITLPASGQFAPADQEDSTQLVIQCKNTSGGSLLLNMLDLLLIPVDEWSADFIDTVQATDPTTQAGSQVGTVGYFNRYLDADSATDAKQLLKALVRVDKITDETVAVWQTVSSAPFTLDPQTQTRLYFIFADTDAPGASMKSWQAKPYLTCLIAVYAVQRFLGMRGTE